MAAGKVSSIWLLGASHMPRYALANNDSGTAGCPVHAVPGAATAASEYKLLKVSEYEAKLLKVRGSERDMDQRHVLYMQMP